MQYRKKPVVVEAFQWKCDIDKEIWPGWILKAIRSGDIHFVCEGSPYPIMRIKTLEGCMAAIGGDYIIKGIKGEIYPCRADIFEATYEPAGE